MSEDRVAVQFYKDIRLKGAAAIRDLAELAKERHATITHDGLTRARAELLRDAADKLEGDQFVIALVGEFSRGKSSLLNALLDRPDLLPTSIEPSTAAITILQYDERERARVTYADGEVADNVPLSDLPRYVIGEDLDGRKAYRASSGRLTKLKTEEDVEALSLSEIGDEVTRRWQATSARPVKYVDVFLPSPLLKDGITLVDTPGIGSVNPEHGQATREFINKADAVIFLINTDPVISDSECTFLMFLDDYIDHFVFAVTKIDRFSQAEREESINYTRRIIEDNVGILNPPIYPVSAKLFQEGRQAASADKIRDSGFPDFQLGLDRYLIREHGHRVLESTSREVRMHLNDIANSIDTELRALSLTVEEFHQRSQAIRKGVQDTQYVRQAITSDIDNAIRNAEDLIMGDFDWLRAKTTLKSRIADEIYSYNWGELQRANELIPLHVKDNLKQLLLPILTTISDQLATTRKDAVAWAMETLVQLGVETGFEAGAVCEEAEWEIFFETSSSAFTKNLQKVGTMTIGSTLALTIAGLCLFGGFGAIAMLGGLLVGGGTTALMLKKTREQLEREVTTALDGMMDQLLEDLKLATKTDLSEFRNEVTELLDSALSNVSDTLEMMEQEHSATYPNLTLRRTELEAQLGHARRIDESLNQLRMFAGYVAGEHVRALATSGA